jgi:hypothetical protein
MSFLEAESAICHPLYLEPPLEISLIPDHKFDVEYMREEHFQFLQKGHFAFG